MTAPPPPQSDNRTGFWFVHDPRFKYVTAGVPIVVGVLIFLAFFVSPWVSADADRAEDAAQDQVDSADALVEELADISDQDEDEIRDQLKEQFSGFSASGTDSYTAWSIWRGAEGAVLRFDEDYKGEDGFGQVETRDRILILVPLLGLALAAVGGAYLTDRLDLRRTLFASIAIAAVLFILPLFWEFAKTGYIRNGMEDQGGSFLFGTGDLSDDAQNDVIDIAMASITSAFATFEFVFLSFLALLFSVGTYFILQSEHKRLGTNWPPPINPFPSAGSAGTSPPPTTDT